MAEAKKSEFERPAASHLEDHHARGSTFEQSAKPLGHDVPSKAMEGRLLHYAFIGEQHEVSHALMVGTNVNCVGKVGRSVRPGRTGWGGARNGRSQES